MDYLTVALILFFIGVVLLAAEVLLPTGGILVVASLLFFALGVGIIFIRGSTMEAVVATGGVALGLPVAFYIVISAWKRLAISADLPGDDPNSPSATSASSELDSLKNHTGKTVSPMRPSGTVEFDGRRIDAMTEGVMLEAGVWVRCVSAKAGKVIVRQMESPADIENIERDDPFEDDGTGRQKELPPPVDRGPSPPESRRPRAEDLDDLDLGFDK